MSMSKWFEDHMRETNIDGDMSKYMGESTIISRIDNKTPDNFPMRKTRISNMSNQTTTLPHEAQSLVVNRVSYGSNEVSTIKKRRLSNS